MSDPADGRAIPVRPNLAATTKATPTPTPTPTHRPPPHDDLERHKGIIKKLYLDDGITLREVMGVMEKQYGVKAT